MKNYGSYINQIFQKKLLIFGTVWGLISALIYSYIVVIVNALNDIMNILLSGLIWGLGFPGWLSSKIPFIGQNTTFLILASIAISLLLSPIAYKIFDVIMSIFKKSPI